MNQQPDKLFRDKLQHHQRHVSDMAWLKLENKLDRKRPAPIWLKVAATLLLALTVSSLLILRDQFTTTMVADAEKEKKQHQHERVAETSPIKTEIAQVPLDTNGTEKKLVLPKAKSSKQFVKPSNPMVEDKSRNEPIVAQNDVLIQEVKDSVTSNQTEITGEDMTVSQRGIVIVYAANAVNEKYLIKKDTVQATTENKKPSTLQKLWSKAKDLKHNQDPFGELRQKKNEILALDFKKEDQRNQNR